MSGNAPSNDEETMSSQTPQEESGATALQNEADPVGILQICVYTMLTSQQTQGQHPQGPSEDDLRYMINDLDLLQADVIFRLRGYIHILRVRDATRPSTPVPSEISVDQLSTQQILDLRRIVEHDIKEVRCLAAIRKNSKKHSRGLNEVEKALKSAKEVADPGFWELINGYVQPHRSFSRSLAIRMHRLRRIIENS